MLSKTENKREGVYGRPEYVWSKYLEVILWTKKQWLNLEEVIRCLYKDV
jgi:hypothetical protein